MIDTHCHLGKDDYEDVSLVIRNMENNIMIVSGVDDNTNLEVLDLCHQYSNVYGTIGIHPTEISSCDEGSLRLLEKYLLDDKIVGIGEIGLDYHYGDEMKELQKYYFEEQLKLAKKYHKTVVIHCRDAVLDTLEILDKMDVKDLKIVFHCYSSSVEVAKILLKYNVMFGIGGVVTFKNSVKLKDVVREIPLSRLLLETDSPYLAPVPFRGMRNEPKNILYVAEAIADIKNISVDDVLCETTSNAIKQFDLNI